MIFSAKLVYFIYAKIVQKAKNKVKISHKEMSNITQGRKYNQIKREKPRTHMTPKLSILLKTYVRAHYHP